MDQKKLINWLLEGDVSIQYQVWRDILGTDKKKLRERIAFEGWGRKFLAKRNADGHWGDRFYQPKWISTHYTLLDLRNLCLAPDNETVAETISLVLENNTAGDGGIRLGPSTAVHSDVCVNAMFLNYASYFKTPERSLRPVLDSILKEIMPDGGFNCQTTITGARHSSMHTTISAMEGLTEFKKTGSPYRKREIDDALATALEFILRHHLFRSHRTGKIINKDFLKLTYPCRWKYDILRALDYFQYSATKWDERMQEALNILLSKRNENGTWNMPSAHAGQVHFTMEQAGKEGRWNTLRALRVLKKYN